MMDGASARIAAFAAGFGQHPLTQAQRRQAYRAFLDTYACAIAGLSEPAARIAAQYAAEQGGSGRAQAWGTSQRLPAEAAALQNGVAAHVLDYDDVMTPMRAHVSATLVPALAALAPACDADGRRYASAYIAGFEVMAKFARVMALPHYTKGWHSTSALGILGATTACGVMLGLDARQHADALGLAVAQAAGTRQNFGAMAKSFQSAHCAASAIRSARLAQLGYTAAADAIDGRYGYLALYADGEDMGPMLATLGQGELEIDAIGIDVKKYPCCYALHRALDGLLALRAQHRLDAAHVARIRVLTSAGGLQALISHPPRTGLEAKFSMEFGMACAIIDGAIGFGSFTDQAVRRREVQALMGHVEVVESGGSILPRWSAIAIHMDDGRVFERTVTTARGDAGDPLSDEELSAKAQDCFALAGHAADARAFARRVLDMDDITVESVLEETS
jgi:2-methylcitrate dehydratase PrpD